MDPSQQHQYQQSEGKYTEDVRAPRVVESTLATVILSSQGFTTAHSMRKYHGDSITSEYAWRLHGIPPKEQQQWVNGTRVCDTWGAQANACDDVQPIKQAERKTVARKRQ